MSRGRDGCDICGAIEPLPYKCKWCGGTFCSEHRLPEKHDCINRFNQKYYWNNPKIQKPIYNNQFRTHHYKKDVSTDKPQYNKRIQKSILKIRRRLTNLLKNLIHTIITITAVTVTIVFLGAIFFSSYLDDYVEPIIDTIESQNPIYQKSIDSSYPNMSQCYVTEYRNATDPSYNELINFLRIDRTEQGLYVPGEHVCINFAIELHDNAEKNHIKAHVFSVDFTNGESHAFDGFNTTDQGWVYIDDTGFTVEQKATGAPNTDSIVNPIVGSPYIPRPIFPLPGGWIASTESMGTVSWKEQLC